MAKKVLLFSSVEWNWLKQRPHFMAEELAKLGCQVTYLAIDPKGKTSCKISDNLKICEITGVRGYMRTVAIRYIAKLKIQNQLKNQDFDVVVLTNPIQMELLPQKILKTAKIIYDCMDLLTEFYVGRKRRLIQNLEKQLCNTADHIVVSAEPLKRFLCLEYGVTSNQCMLLYNALSPTDCVEALKREPIALMRHPAMIYMGTIEHWLDIKTLDTFMQKNSEWHLYMVGKIGTGLYEKLKAIPNCHILGAMEHVEALRYVNSADVALLPFQIGGLVDMVDPVKLYEYFALGKPVVSSYWPALEHFVGAGEIYFYQDYETFEKALIRPKKTMKNMNDLKEFIQENSWASRASRLLEIINQ